MGSQLSSKKIDVLILAAGKGTRTNSTTPKCLIKIGNKTLLEYQIESLRAHKDIENIYMVIGHEFQQVQKMAESYITDFVINNRYNETNMVSSFLCAQNLYSNKDLIVSYADIVYSPQIIKNLCQSKNHFDIVVDTDWLDLWTNRFEDPYSDAETLVIKNENIVEIGNKIQPNDKVEAQYIGLMKFSPKALEIISKVCSQEESINGRPLEGAYFTDLLNQLIQNGQTLSPVYTNGKWFEIDTENDLELYRKSLLAGPQDIYSLGRSTPTFLK